VVSVRGDAARLPFATGSVSAVHAGAAIHCWPAPELAMAEIARVLKPGGRAVLSTFLVSPVQEALDSALSSVPAPDEFRQVFSSAAGAIRQGPNGSYRFWTKGELATLAKQCGLTGFDATVDRQFILFSVMKPMEEAEVVYSPS
jgi:ubiquinone/menaquinone biosynthesis C-methylase UbiE